MYRLLGILGMLCVAGLLLATGCQTPPADSKPAVCSKESEEAPQGKAAPKKHVAEKEEAEEEDEEAEAAEEAEEAEAGEGGEAGAIMQKYFELVTAGGDPKKVKELGEEFLEEANGNAMLLNDFAWELLTNKGIKQRDLKLAMRTAKAAYDACDGKEAAIVDTYARALHDTGKLDQAIKYQKKALELCKDSGMREEIEATLERYQKEAKK
jgi:tetratricopeptide (TPR) repeat protein